MIQDQRQRDKKNEGGIKSKNNFGSSKKIERPIVDSTIEKIEEEQSENSEREFMKFLDEVFGCNCFTKGFDNKHGNL